MNGITYSSLMSNTGLFADVAFKGTITTGTTTKKSSTDKTDSNKQTNTDKDTYEHTQSTEVKAGYDRPKRVQAPETEESDTSEYKSIDSDGIQEGIELSDAAKDLLKELREKYGDTMEISVANWSTDEESDYYASLTSKGYSVLINPELLEKMASDESVREEYESILSGASENSDQLKEELGDDADSIQSFTITIDADGNTTYAVKLLKEMAESSKADSKTLAEQQRERLEEKKEEEKAEEKEAEKKEEQEELTERLEASSMDELIEKIKSWKASA